MRKYNIIAPRMFNTPKTFWAAKYRSAIIPIKNGATIMDIENAVYALPTWEPVASRLVKRYLLICPYQAPQIKNWRNIMTDSRIWLFLFMK